MVGFQVPLGRLAVSQVVQRYFPNDSAGAAGESIVGTVTIVDSTNGEPRKGSVLAGTTANMFGGAAYLKMPKPWVQVGVPVDDLPGVVPQDYVPLAVDTLRRLLQSENLEQGIFTLWQELCMPLLSWSSEGVVLHQYDYQQGGHQSMWNGPGYSHHAVAEAVLVMLEEMSIAFAIERSTM